MLSQYDKAVETYKKGLEYYPENYSFWFNMGVALGRLNKKAEAEKAFNKAEQFKDAE
jgi:tetratricopeptide (TPR) repeat protein